MTRGVPTWSLAQISYGAPGRLRVKLVLVETFWRHQSY